MKSSLYSQLLIQASRDTEFAVPPPPASQKNYHTGTGHNPLCGDKVRWFVEVDAAGKRLGDIRFEASGCMMCKASAGFLARFLRHTSLAGALHIYEEVDRITDNITDKTVPAADQEGSGEAWRALAQIRDYPARRKCVMMPWNSFFEMLESS